MDDLPFAITSESESFADNKMEADGVVLFKKVWMNIIKVLLLLPS